MVKSGGCFPVNMADIDFISGSNNLLIPLLTPIRPGISGKFGMLTGKRG
jgi:hypothetical protein